MISYRGSDLPAEKEITRCRNRLTCHAGQGLRNTVCFMIVRHWTHNQKKRHLLLMTPFLLSWLAVRWENIPVAAQSLLFFG